MCLVMTLSCFGLVAELNTLQLGAKPHDQLPKKGEGEGGGHFIVKCGYLTQFFFYCAYTVCVKLYFKSKKRVSDKGPLLSALNLFPE